MNEAEKLIKHYLNNPEERYEIRSVMQEHFLKTTLTIILLIIF